MAQHDMPPAEVEVDETAVRHLLAGQHPDLSRLPLGPRHEGWDNYTWRLGSDLAVRLPRRAVAVQLVLNEQRWLPEIATGLPLPVPAPLRTGKAGGDYPWPWSVVPWYDGEVAAAVAPRDPPAAAEALGEFLAALHRPAPVEAPVNPYRGVPLSDRDEATRRRIALLGDLIDGPAATAAWAEAVELPAWEGPALWLHGDLHPANLIVRDGRLSAVIDFGDLTAGDPATDLSVAWMLLPPTARPVLRAAAGGCDDETWTRARACALAHGIATLVHSADNPLMAAMGRRTVEAVLADRA